MGEVGREIRRLREAKGWGQTKLAAAADMAVSGVSQIENGHRNPNSATLIKLARALDVDVADLFPKGQVPLPLDDAPSLEELHAAAGCKTDFLVRAENQWLAAWPHNMRPHAALETLRQLEAEFAAVEPLIAEQDRSLPITKRHINGRYRQAYMRWLNGVMAATDIARKAGEIRPEQTLNDLDERAMRELEQYSRAS